MSIQPIVRVSKHQSVQGIYTQDAAGRLVPTIGTQRTWQGLMGILARLEEATRPQFALEVCEGCGCLCRDDETCPGCQARRLTDPVRRTA